MKKNSYIILALAGMLSMNSCNDDEFLPGNPSMEIKAENADALFGDSLPFTIKASDVDVPLSTLKAQLFYGEEQVSETVIRTKTSGNDYTGKIFVPYYANIPNGKATLKYILQNIHFTTTEMTKELALARPDFPYLTLVDEEGKEYRMERQSMYKYSVTGDFSQKMKAYIKTPKVGENGNELTFGWENGTIEAGSTNAISFSNTEPGNYAIKFNTLTYEAEPFAKLKVNGEDMELVENDIYAIKLTLKKNDILAFEGVPDYDNWWLLVVAVTNSSKHDFNRCKSATCRFLFRDTKSARDKNGTKPRKNKVKDTSPEISLVEYLCFVCKGTNLSLEKRGEIPISLIHNSFSYHCTPNVVIANGFDLKQHGLRKSCVNFCFALCWTFSKTRTGNRTKDLSPLLSNTWFGECLNDRHLKMLNFK